MSVYTAELRKHLTNTFLPFMAEKGFSAEPQKPPFFYQFRRITPQGLEICDIQFDKTGKPRFALNFGQCKDSARDLATMETHDCPVYGRLTPKPGATTKSWFRQDHSFWRELVTGLKEMRAEWVVEDMMNLFPEVEAYWQTGAVGSRLSFVRR